MCDHCNHDCAVDTSPTKGTGSLTEVIGRAGRYEGFLSGGVGSVRQLCYPGSHNYEQAYDGNRAAPLMFCAKCGDIQKLEAPAD